MTKDEAWETYKAVRASYSFRVAEFANTPGSPEQTDIERSALLAGEALDIAVRAYAQAAVDAALEIERNTIIVQEANHDEGQYEEDADTLGMLEALAEKGLGVVAYTETHALEVSIWPVDNELHYQLGYRIEPAHLHEISRAEAEALLKGDADANA